MRREAAGDRIGPWQLDATHWPKAAWARCGSLQRADGVMKRTAALKLPRAEWVDRGLAERIARERAILARLQHPAIAVLYDAGLGRRRPAVSGARVCRRAADRCLVQEPRSRRRSCALFIQVVRAVAYAHGQLVIHRDLKPANVLVTAERTAEAPGLRHLARSSKATRRPRSHRAHAAGGPAADAGLCRPRAGAGAADHGDRRRLCARRDAVRAPDRGAAVSRERATCDSKPSCCAATCARPATVATGQGSAPRQLQAAIWMRSC